MNLELHDIVGFVGGILILASYFLLQTKKMNSDSLFYSILNLVGAIMILFSLLNAWNLTAGIIEIVWVFLSIFGIVKWHKSNNLRNARKQAEAAQKIMPASLYEDKKRA